MTAQRLKPPSGGDDAPRVSARLGAKGPALDLLTLATEICGRYRQEFPDEKKRYGEAGNQWCVHDNQHLLNWGVEAVNGHLDINQEVSWLASVLEARGFPIERLARTLELGAAVILEQVSGPPGVKLALVLSGTATFVRSSGSFLDYTV
jgi:hypothetical protein